DKRSPLRRLFTSRSFVALFVSNALGFGGEQMRLAAQSWWILDEGGSKTEMGIAAGLRVVPVVIISLYAGVLIDRVGGKRVLILERLLLIFLAIITGLILLIDEVEIWHIVVLATIAGSTIALGTPATQTLVPAVVPKDLLQSANSMNQLGFALGRTLGPLLAGILIARTQRGAGPLRSCAGLPGSVDRNVRNYRETRTTFIFRFRNPANSRRAFLHSRNAGPHVDHPYGVLGNFLRDDFSANSGLCEGRSRRW
ncbi:MAG: MFS transporter, partial [Chloroflexi bacterium]|nr:MFS transporter [Chloroflexota bacterium]